MLAFGIIVAGVAFGSAIGDGIVASKAVEAIARQPEARPNIMMFMFLGVGVLEAFPIIALGLAFYMYSSGSARHVDGQGDGSLSGSMFLKARRHVLVVQLVNFAIFFALLNVVFLRPVGRAIMKRRQYIDGLVADYDRYQGEAQTLREEAEAIRADARRKAEATVAPSPR